jgi:hypothetical protein
MYKKYFIVIAMFTSFFATAQTFDYSLSNRWSDKPIVHTVKSVFDSSSAVGLIDDRKIEYKIEGKEMYIFATNYKLIKIINDRGIEMYNKVYIPVYAGQQVTELKARTILKNGKVIDLPADKIKETDEDGKHYKLFALEGVEKGAEIEYTFTTRKEVSVFGLDIFQSTNIPNQQSYFSLITPANLKFDAKGFNGFNVSADSVIGERRIIVGFSENIPAIEEEKYSLRDPLMQRVEYKLSYNLYGKADVRLYTWKEFAKKAYTIYTTLTSKEIKAVEILMKQLTVDNSASEEKRILQVEDFLKKTINADQKITGEDVDNLEKVVKTKNTNREGIVKLFAAVFDKLNINYQFVLPSNRGDIPLDEDVENWRSIEEILIYFPKTKKFICPYATDYRYPFVPPYVCGTRGLFLKTTTIGTLKTAIGSFDDIEMEPFEKHAHNMDVVIKFDDNLENILISSKQILLGYGATSYRPIYTYLPKDKQDETTKDIIKSVAKSDNITNIKVENTDFNDLFDNKPLIISGDIKTTEMIEKAGNKTLLKIGEIIGKQEEMYQEKPRQLPIELSYPHALNRKVVFEIPSGYTIKNLNDINLNISFKEEDIVTMGFISSYVVNGNKVEISINETYHNLKYPLTAYNNFKKVINAAADFNKVVLVLEKK